MDLSSIESKIKSDLKKSGFYSEMLALKIFRQKKWYTTGISSFFDLDSNISRESDISAYLVKYEKINNKIIAETIYDISAEVKKAEKPWIVFKEKPIHSFRLSEAWSGLIFRDGIEAQGAINSITPSLQKNSLGEKLGWIGTGLHEFSKSPDQPSRWYSSLITVCKAAEDKLKSNSWDTSKGDHDHYPYLHLIKPIIILDGQLLSAELDEGEIKLEIIKYASIHFDFQTEKYKRGSYKIDIVTLDSLPEYLDLASQKHLDIHKKIKKIAQIKYSK